MKRVFGITISTLIVLVILGLVAYYITDNDYDDQIAGFGTRDWCKKYSLDVGKTNGERITEVISTMGNTSTLGLAFKSKHLRAIGRLLDKQVATFEFLGYIFSHTNLVIAMVEVQKSSFKYDNFIEGLYDGMMKESKSKCFKDRMKAFAKSLDLDPGQTEKIIEDCVKVGEATQDKMAFKPFVDYLIAQRSKAVQGDPNSKSGGPMIDDKSSDSSKDIDKEKIEKDKKDIEKKIDDAEEKIKEKEKSMKSNGKRRKSMHPKNRRQTAHA